jgi:hypothetical protein
MHRKSGSRALRPVKLLGRQRKILSRKRYNLFHVVYSLITLNITAAVLLSHPCPVLGDQRICHLFACFLSNAGEGMHKVGGGAYFTHLYIYRYTHIYIYIFKLNILCVFQVRQDAVNIFTDFSAGVGPNELFPKPTPLRHSCLLSLDMSRLNRSPCCTPCSTSRRLKRNITWLHERPSSPGGVWSHSHQRMSRKVTRGKRRRLCCCHCCCHLHLRCHHCYDSPH